MSKRLRSALRDRRKEIEVGLREARDRFAAVDQERIELLDLIREAEEALGEEPAPLPYRGRLTLHEAMEEVLRKRGNPWTKAADLHAEILKLDLYRGRDGRPPAPNQIHARAGNYPDLFEKQKGGLIRLRAFNPA